PTTTSTSMRRLGSIRRFIEFSDECGQAIDDRLSDSGASVRLARTLKRLRALEKSKASGVSTKRRSEYLTPAQLETFFAVLHPKSKFNPFTNDAVRLRNYCI